MAPAIAPAEPPTEPPTFYGKLSLEVPPFNAAKPERCGPVLFLTHICPFCHGVNRFHHHTWGVQPDGSAVTEAHPRTAHCQNPRSPFHGKVSAYFIAPADTAENQRVLDEYRAAIETYRERLRAISEQPAFQPCTPTVVPQAKT